MTLTDLIDDRHWPLYKAIVSTDLVEQLDANVRATTVPSPIEYGHRWWRLQADFAETKPLDVSGAYHFNEI